MEKRVSLLLLVISVSVLTNEVDGEAKVRHSVSEIDRKLKHFNKPAIKTIKSEDGDIIDCVDIHKQPALDHPALKNHKIQMRPSFDLPTEKSKRKNDLSRPMILQTWQKSGSCTEGTVPIRRIRRQDLWRAASLEQFGRKPPQIPYASNKTEPKKRLFAPINNTKFQPDSLVNRATAFLATVGYNYLGAKGDINVWNPKVDLPDDYTTAQIWLKAGSDNFESIESGWTVNPQLYGDSATRLFVYWTKDAYKSTGCFDLTCSGFVQTSTQIVLGGAIYPWSSEFGPQYYLPFEIYMDSQTGHWWLRVKNGTVVGYWPKDLFAYLSHSAILVQWGGEVYSKSVWKSPHTRTQMGSGSFASTLYASACFIQHVRIVDYSLQWKYPRWVGVKSEQPDCYSGDNHSKGYPIEPIFYFGGPGQNPFCR